MFASICLCFMNLYSFNQGADGRALSTKETQSALSMVRPKTNGFDGLKRLNELLIKFVARVKIEFKVG